MKFTAFVLSLLALVASSNVFADARNVLISFSTPGPDKYADGATVVDGECYALVWTKSGESFAGFTSSGDAVKEGQKVLYKAPLAKGGRCPFVVFQLDSATAPEGGVYSVYLLDTRGGAGQTVVTGSTLAKTYAMADGVSKEAVVAEDRTVDASGKPASLQASTAGVVLDPAVVAPVIKGFRVEGGEVKITVANVFPGFAYEVSGGASPASRETIASKVTAKGENTIELSVDKDAAKFFSIKAR